MRIGAFFSLCLCLALLANLSVGQPVFAAPIQHALVSVNNTHSVSDTCWWWGTRWQYGWRGYGWYTCWDEVRPFPSEIAREAIPQSASEPVPCAKRRQDSTNKRHTRTVC